MGGAVLIHAGYEAARAISALPRWRRLRYPPFSIAVRPRPLRRSSSRCWSVNPR